MCRCVPKIDGGVNKANYKGNKQSEMFLWGGGFGQQPDGIEKEKYSWEVKGRERDRVKLWWKKYRGREKS